MNESPVQVARKVKAKRSAAPGATVRLRSARIMLLVLSATFLVAAAWTIASSFIFLHGPESAIELALGAAIAAFAVVFFVLPMLRGNMLSGMSILVRYGIQFSEEVPLYEVAQMERLSRLPASSGLLGGGVRLGVEYSLFDNRFTVLRSKRGIIRMRLANEIIVRSWLIPRRVKEIIFDTLDGDEVLRRYEEVRLLDVK
jgi:hypothetical protein